jgi:hypothetical protein
MSIHDEQAEEICALKEKVKMLEDYINVLQIELEKHRNLKRHIKEELKKFTQGFAYVRGKGDTASGIELEVHGLECEGDEREHEKDR